MHRVHARWLMARARKGELTDPKGAAAHDETECVLRRHALASITGPDWPRLAVGARQWRVSGASCAPDTNIRYFVELQSCRLYSLSSPQAFNEQSRTMGIRPGGPRTVLPRRKVASIAR
jgi:hypothetical protein